MALHLRAMACHLSYEITQCYLPSDTFHPTQVNTPHVNPSQKLVHDLLRGLESWFDI